MAPCTFGGRRLALVADAPPDYRATLAAIDAKAKRIHRLGHRGATWWTDLWRAWRGSAFPDLPWAARAFAEAERTRWPYLEARRFEHALQQAFACTVFDESLLLGLQELLVPEVQAHGLRSCDIEILGARFRPPKAEEVRPRLQALIAWYRQLPRVHPVLAAAMVHERIVAIHPFVDGNGRVARLLMATHLVRHGYPPACLTAADRLAYVAYLEAAAADDRPWPFRQLIASRVDAACAQYLAADREDLRPGQKS